MSRREELGHLELANGRLLAAQDLLRDGHTRDAASRAYYAMFHAAHALLSRQGLEARTHRGTLALLREHFKESMGQEALGDMAAAQDLREASDYDVMFRIDPDEVADLLERAASFVHRVESLVA